MSLSGILIVLLIGVASGEDCCGCWDRCFPQRLDADTELFRNMINTLRGLTIGSNIKATAYMMDETADTSIVWEYQKRVAALVALTQQVNNNCPSNCCNGFMTSRYRSNLAYFSSSWQCKDKCQAAQTLLTFSPALVQSSANWIGGSCLLGTQPPPSIPCQVLPKNRMAIGFINNDKQYDTGFCVNANYAVRVAVKVGPSSTPLGYLQPPAIPFEIDVSYTPSRYKTVTILLRCVRERSCDAPLSPFIRQDAPMNITFVSPNMKTPVTKSFQSLDEFNKAVSELSEYVTVKPDTSDLESFAEKSFAKVDELN